MIALPSDPAVVRLLAIRQLSRVVNEVAEQLAVAQATFLANVAKAFEGTKLIAAAMMVTDDEPTS